MEKETSLKKMKLSIRQEDVVPIAISNTKDRKQIWEEWKKFNPDSQKRWKIASAKDSDSLKCQAVVVIKKVSAEVEIKTYQQDDLNSSGDYLDQISIQSDESQDLEGLPCIQ